MSDDWAPGDLALCWDAVNNPLLGTRCGLVRGKIYTVRFVDLAEAGWADEGTVGLILNELSSASPSGGFRASRFIKVTPDLADTDDIQAIYAYCNQPQPAEV